MSDRFSIVMGLGRGHQNIPELPEEDALRTGQALRQLADDIVSHGARPPVVERLARNLGLGMEYGWFDAEPHPRPLFLIHDAARPVAVLVARLTDLLDIDFVAEVTIFERARS
jgi:hypothetical protein